MSQSVINLSEKFRLFDDRWSPKVIAEMNDYQFKLVKVEGEFTWHKHNDTDEVFLVVDGELDIQLQGETVTLRAGELYVVPKGVLHRPVAKSVCQIMLVEPRGVVNTGDEISELTAAQDIWI